ncbi:MFS transporter [Trinickia dinghuensis]|uniref:MFS transporter n=1 Tax=Trinickia dinghuensis TaxID=2291023 RepID=A0A3D8K1E2_9BURK|nr:MFS transporter [Trinickia dinghuensis]RDU98882.1 MFS transporter [Trinickia dinghuensis]
MNDISAALPIDRPVTASSWRIIASASIGNALEWFDLVAYGFFAITISRLFFPAGSASVSLMLTLGTFGVSFFMRPLGAVVLGVYADKAGRKAALTLSILLMMTGTLLIAVMPTYTSIGLVAPVGMVLARMIQGFSAGGEFGSATAFLAEYAPTRRGFFASWQAASQGLTTLIAAGFGSILSSTLSDAQMQSWGWRIPFLFGLLIGPVAYYIRTQIDETPEFTATERAERPLTDTLANQKERLLLAMSVVVLGTVSSYLILFMPTYAVKQLGIPSSSAFSAIVVTGVVQMIGAPLAGHWSDLHGRTRIMLGAAVLFLLLAWPAFAYLAAHPTFGAMIGIQLFIGVIMIAYFGPLPALLSELFPTQTRTTGMSIAYNLSVTVFGGFSPFIITWLISASGSTLAPSFYIMVAAAASIVALLRVRAIGLR